MTVLRLVLCLCLAGAAILMTGCDAAMGEITSGGVTPAEEEKPMDEGQTEKATFAAGCFWGVEEAFRNVDGVVSTEVGYTGGSFPEPTYEDVCSGKTGHAEAVRVIYDPAEITYERLLEVFWNCHDPTSLNRQGLDVGDQYRSAIFYHSEEQKAAALASKGEVARSGIYEEPVVTRIEPASTFWPAEEYHQKYLAKRGRSSCGL